MNKRVFLIILDSLGIGELPDASLYGDEGSNTLKSVYQTKFSEFPNLRKLGLFNIEGVDYAQTEEKPTGSFARLACASKGKDTTIGHWEIAGVISKTPLPTYPKGFPKELLDKFSEKTGCSILCNLPYSGTEVIAQYGKEHMETGALIIYTSADSVFQIAAHEAIVPIEKLYEYCEIARDFLCGEHSVGRVIARPFIGEVGRFERTTNRHDYSLAPPEETMLDKLMKNGFDTIGVGKISDIFCGKGVSASIKTKGNTDGISKIFDCLEKEFNGLCFINLVDFDMLYGHRNDVLGYAKALDEFDRVLPNIMEKLSDDDILMIAADHGCDPLSKGSDHSREYVPLLIYSKMKESKDMKTLDNFCVISDYILKNFDLS